LPSEQNPQGVIPSLLGAGKNASTDVSGSSIVRSDQLKQAKTLAPEVFVILLYIVISRLSLGNEAEYGIWIGPVPIFPTDVTLVLLIMLTLYRRRAWFQRWILKGEGAGSIGRAVWLFCILAVIYFVFAWPAYGILALRDLAMFGYSLFFPITYVIIRNRDSAVRIARYVIYGSLILGVPFALQVLTGQNFLLDIEGQSLMTTSGLLHRMPIGDLGSNIGFTMAALLAYLLLGRNHKWINAAAALVCLIVIAASLTRSAVLGVAAALPLTFLFMSRRQRIAFVTIGGVGLLLLVAYSTSFQDLTAAVKSGTTIFDDADFQFRLFRWAEAVALWLAHPLLGAGFGVGICTPDPNESGLFNVGMPHNSYLTLLARAGVVGLGLFLFCFEKALRSLLKNLRDKGIDAESLAVANILIAMGVFAGFNLFLEEPLLIGPFWIMLAVACRLAETSPARVAVAGRRAPAPIPSPGQIPAAV
jgi:O-antigen ligase